MRKQPKKNILRQFCEFEIKGFNLMDQQVANKVDENREFYKYRVQTILVSLKQITHTMYLNISQLKQTLSNDKDFFDIPYFIKEPISNIEISMIKTDVYAIVSIPVRDVLPGYQKDHSVYGYIFPSDLKSVYENIRQKLIDLIMESK